MSNLGNRFVIIIGITFILAALGFMSMGSQIDEDLARGMKGFSIGARTVGDPVARDLAGPLAVTATDLLGEIFQRAGTLVGRPYVQRPSVPGVPRPAAAPAAPAAPGVAPSGVSDAALAQEYAARAQRAWDRGDLDSALENAQQALTFDPKHNDALRVQSAVEKARLALQACLEATDFDAQISECEAALKVNKNIKDAQTALKKAKDMKALTTRWIQLQQWVAQENTYMADYSPQKFYAYGVTTDNLRGLTVQLVDIRVKPIVGAFTTSPNDTAVLRILAPEGSNLPDIELLTLREWVQRSAGKTDIGQVWVVK